ncbi:phage tail tube assembly chaperone [Levilactobacillus sp. N40-8-2]|uniref:phage tail tube assembly chaperone n=1 Tax=Levilactobacillus muriae TaxID=3238987 RepID=UPI0038B23D44
MADYIEFKAPEIGVNRVKKIKPTNKIIRKVLVLQLTQSKSFSMKDDPETTEEMQTYVDGTIKLIDETEDFLATTLSLNKKQKDSLEDLTQEELGDLSGRLQFALMHVDEDVPDTDGEDEPNPK